MAATEGFLAAALALVELIALMLPALSILLYVATDAASPAENPVLFATGFLAIAGFAVSGAFVLGYLILALEPPSLLVIGLLIALAALASTVATAFLLYRASRSQVSLRLSDAFRR